MPDHSATLPAGPTGANPRRDIRRAIVAGVATIAMLAGTVGLWAATAPFAGAVIASGKVVVEDNVRKIQHPSGGVVSEIHVRDGDRVHAGDILLRLDNTHARASLALIDIELNRFLARAVRLNAERDGRAGMQVPESMRPHANHATFKDALAGELSLFRSRRDAAELQRLQLRERITQTQEEIRGLAEQLGAAQTQARIIENELGGVRSLYAQNLVALSRLTALQREASRISGEEGTLRADTARARGKIAEIELHILQIDQDIRREASTDLRETDAKIADLSQRRFAAHDQLARVEMRAPQDGVVHQRTVHTIGGVIGPAEEVMVIVPESDSLLVEARVEPAMIDRLHVGQSAVVRLPAFDSATTPDLRGTLRHISADTSVDQQTGVSFYTARVAMQREELSRLDGKELTPGMPAELFIETGVRTPLRYVMKPIADQLARTFRHD